MTLTVPMGSNVALYVTGSGGAMPKRLATTSSNPAVATIPAGWTQGPTPGPIAMEPLTVVGPGSTTISTDITDQANVVTHDNSTLVVTPAGAGSFTVELRKV